MQLFRQHMPFIALFCAFSVGLLASCSIGTPAIEGYAVVYGISLYDPAFGEGVGNNLAYPDDDAESVSALFKSQGYSVITRINSSASLENLIGDIAYVAEGIHENESFIFYFSGHGVSYTLSGTNTQSEPSQGDSPDEWIFLYGSVDYDSLIDLTKALSDDRLAQIITPIQSNRKVVIIDACNSGGFIGTQCEVDGISQDGASEADHTFIDVLTTYASYGSQEDSDVPANLAMVVSAAGEQELSYEADEYSHGIFTYHLLDSVYDGDLNSDGIVTLSECYAYVKNAIALTWRYEPFVPRISGGPIDFALFNAASSYSSSFLSHP